ncbi:MAG: 5-formyltetrahydrofolate cyclo-ligase [Bacteroides sp.]|nr:5-formyltetrahydrofolate cyclo-ligase [Bacteroides sp.]MCM1379726.1 5-formyltetrahydrofolate cyclo-ligase [Bacteroides sp.]MCM1446081.1 5-formyltetrahydrofolate cyclo-ligase [Prevotella sp.]
MDKSSLRRRIKTQKSLLTQAERLTAASAVFAALERTAAFLLADRILVYSSLPDELSTREFIDKWAGRKHFFLPRVNGVNLELLPYERTRLHLGAFHIEEPDGDEIVDPALMDLIVVPAVAMDSAGNRLGRGRGFYDRLLASTRATAVGVGYDFQLVAEGIPVEPHDAPLDIVITENHVYRRSRNLR